MQYKILNKDEVDTFIWECAKDGGAAIGVKGDPPADATYEDGTPITNQINVAWMDSVTKQRCEIIRVPVE